MAGAPTEHGFVCPDRQEFIQGEGKIKKKTKKNSERRFQPGPNRGCTVRTRQRFLLAASSWLSRSTLSPKLPSPACLHEAPRSLLLLVPAALTRLITGLPAREEPPAFPRGDWLSARGHRPAGKPKPPGMRQHRRQDRLGAARYSCYRKGGGQQSLKNPIYTKNTQLFCFR